jgi:hypothetical protein
VTDVAVIGGLGWVRRRCGKSVSGVIVEDQSGVAVRVVSISMPPVERAAADDHGEHRGKSPMEPTTPCAQPHAYRL